MKKIRGITLISLVITVIVLLILAGTTVAMLTGDNGILTQTQNAKEKNEYKEAEEKVKLSVLTGRNEDGKYNIEKIKEEVNNYGGNTIGTEFPLLVTISKYKFTVDFDGNINKQLEEINKGETAINGNKKYVSDNKEVVIPEGFKVSDKEDECSIENGLVIIGQDGSEFVWVEVPVAVYDGKTAINQSYTPMSELQSDSKTNYQGMFYSFSGTTSTYLENYKIGTTNYREPSLVTGNYNDTKAVLSNISGTNYDANEYYYKTLLGYNSAKEFGENMQNNYNDMVNSVARYGGFYVGRYELGIENKMPVSKNASKNLGVTTTTEANTDTYMWYGLYKLCKLYNTPQTTSTMIWGSQYDAMMNWLAKKGKTIGNADETIRNKEQITGKSELDKICNIYDLYGSNCEMTMEACGNDGRVNRGGYFTGNYAPSSYNNHPPTDTIPDRTSRLTLYIK